MQLILRHWLFILLFCQFFILFLMDFGGILGFSIHKKSYLQTDNFTSFSCLIALFTTPGLCLIEMAKTTVLAFFLLLEENLSVFYHWLWCLLWVFHIWLLLHWDSFFLFLVCWVFYVVNFFFCISWDDHVVFFLHSVLVVINFRKLINFLC